LEKRIALVTGAGRGVGCSISLTLAESGAHVLPGDRNLDHHKEVEEATGSFKGSASIVLILLRPAVVLLFPIP
jgi:NAD(P)-dependent dehydrogenase (short-subunit alcohol dehydrogenase family)